MPIELPKAFIIIMKPNPSFKKCCDGLKGYNINNPGCNPGKIDNASANSEGVE